VIVMRTVLFAAFAAASLSPARAQMPKSPSQAEICAALPPAGTEDMAMLNKLMVQPRKFNSLADMMKDLPPDAMAKFGAMQKAAAERQAKDWPNLCRYAAENAEVASSGTRPDVVFMGDSITDNWRYGDPSLFNAKVLDRGIGGQTTPQMLLRFYPDVLSFRPKVVHIMAGTNDVSGNTGAETDETIVSNIRAMIDLAKANRIRVVLSAITPSKQFVARPGVDPSARIAAVNKQLVKLAAEMHVTFVDYTPVLADSAGGLADALGNDGLHPNRDGYAKMRPLTEAAIKRAMKK
jgi:lysophospholipase L1-like esterase